MGVAQEGNDEKEAEGQLSVSIWNNCTYPSKPEKFDMKVKLEDTFGAFKQMIVDKTGYSLDSFVLAIINPKVNATVDDNTTFAELNIPQKRITAQLTKVPGSKQDFANLGKLSLNNTSAPPGSPSSPPPSSGATSIASNETSHAIVPYGPQNAAYGPQTAAGSYGRDTSSYDWNKKSKTGFVGLSNQGATCYLNSLIQSLYMTPEFRNAVYLGERKYTYSNRYKWDFEATYKKRRELGERDKSNKMDVDKEHPKTEMSEEEKKKQFEKDSIPRQLQLLFARLQLRDQRAVKTKALTSSFGWKDSEAFTQHDVQELCRVLFEALEKVLKGTEQENLINDLYQGEMKDYVKCKECGTESSRTDKYLDIPLVIRGFGSTTSVQSAEEALEKFIQPEILENDNQYFCEKCNKKVDALKGLKFAAFPYLLCMQLKRFDFDYATMRRIKLNDHVSFPLILDMNKFIDPNSMVITSPSSEKPPKRKRIEDEDSMDHDSQEGKEEEKLSDKESEIQTLLAKGPYVYELYSVLIHRGSALGGHYYAYIKSFDTDKWYEFNDSSVSEIKEEEIQKTFGEEDDKYNRSGMSYYYSSSNAYMLMYRRIDPTKNVKPFGDNEIPDQLKRGILEEVEKKKRKVEEKEREKEMTRLKVLYGLEEKIVKVHNKKTVAEATIIVAAEYGVASKYPPDCIRIRNYQSYNDLPAEPFDTPESLTKTVEELHWHYYNPKTVMLETKLPSEAFPEYNASDMLVRVIRYDQEQHKFLDPQPIYVGRQATLADLKKQVALKMRIPPEHQRIVREFMGYGGPSAKVLQGDDGSLQTEHRVFEASKVWVEYCTDTESESPAFAEIERTRNMMEIKFNMPGKEETDKTLHVSKKITYLELKKMLQPIVGLPLGEFKVSRGSSAWRTELRNENDTLDDCKLFDGCKLYIEKGVPLKDGETPVKFILFDPENKRTKDNIMDLFELNVQEKMNLEALRELVSAKLKEEKQIEIPPSHILEINMNPGKILRGNGRLSEYISQYSSSHRLAVQEIPAPEAVKPNDLVFFLQQWFPSKFELGPKTEICLPETMTTAELRQLLSDKYGIKNVGLAEFLPWTGQEVLEYNNWPWERDLSVHKSTLVGAPLFIRDGELVIFRDNDEPVKELTKDERRKLEKESQSRKSRSTYHHKEEALTINAKV